jgi:hypothetical protein
MKLLLCLTSVFIFISCESQLEISNQSKREPNSQKQSTATSIRALEGKVSKLIVDNENSKVNVFYQIDIPSLNSRFTVSANEVEGLNLDYYSKLDNVILELKVPKSISKSNQRYGQTIEDVELLSVQEIEKRFSALNQSSPMTISNSTDPHELARLKVAFVAVHFKDEPAYYVPDADHVSKVKSMFEDSTWGRVVIESGAEDIYEVTSSRSYKGCDGSGADGAFSIAKDHAMAKKRYDRVIAYIPGRAGKGCGWIGIAVKNSLKNSTPTSLLIRGKRPALVAHELGHSVGLDHSGVDSGTDGVADGQFNDQDDAATRYDDSSCFMGNKGQVIGLNAVKLFKLGALSPKYGLSTPEDGKDLTLYSTSIDPTDHNGATVFVHNQYFISTRSATTTTSNNGTIPTQYIKGVNVHYATGTSGHNLPSSGLVSIVDGTGEQGWSWTAPDDPNFSFTVKNFDYETGTAIIEFNGQGLSEGSIVNGCFVSGVKRTYITHSSIYQGSSGLLKISFSPEAIGNCGDKTFKFKVSTHEESQNVISINAEFETTINLASNSTQTVYIPFTNYNGNERYRINIQASLGTREFDVYSKPVSASGCHAGSPLCTQEDECNRAPLILTDFESAMAQPGLTVNRSILIVNNNASHCSGEPRKYSISALLPNSSGYGKNDFIIGAGNLEDVSTSASNGYQIKKNIYLKSGKSVLVPLTVKFPNKESFSSVRIVADYADASLSMPGVLVFNPSGTMINTVPFNTHPFQPDVLSRAHVSLSGNSSVLINVPDISFVTCKIPTGFSTSDCGDVGTTKSAGDICSVIESPSGAEDGTKWSCNNSGQWELVDETMRTSCKILEGYSSQSAGCGEAGVYARNGISCTLAESPVAEEVGGILTCQNGSWDIPEASASEVFCSHNNTEFTPGVHSITCQGVAGVVAATCQDSGSWSGGCEQANTCQYNSIDYAPREQQYVVVCSSGYGASKRTCDQNGNWREVDNSGCAQVTATTRTQAAYANCPVGYNLSCPQGGTSGSMSKDNRCCKTTIENNISDNKCAPYNSDSTMRIFSYTSGSLGTCSTQSMKAPTYSCPANAISGPSGSAPNKKCTVPK